MDLAPCKLLSGAAAGVEPGHESLLYPLFKSAHRQFWHRETLSAASDHGQIVLDRLRAHERIRQCECEALTGPLGSQLSSAAFYRALKLLHRGEQLPCDSGFVLGERKIARTRSHNRAARSRAFPFSASPYEAGDLSFSDQKCAGAALNGIPGVRWGMPYPLAPFPDTPGEGDGAP
jgi:hypothetical protein